MSVWYPKVEDLQIKGVPEDARPRIRKRLEPWLQTLQDHDFGVEKGDCYAVAQGLVMTAAEPEVRYVEGGWVRLPWDSNDPPGEHGWNTVDGYRVDFVAELYDWDDESDGFQPWDRDYEPIKNYSCEEVLASFVNSHRYKDIIRVFRDSGAMPLSGCSAFHDAIERLTERNIELAI